MRCSNCGWENPDHNTRCEKCGSALSGGRVNNPQQPQTAPQPNFNKTVNEASVFPDMPANIPNVPTVGGQSCPKCGYPLRPNQTKCPNCGWGQPAAPTIPEPKPKPNTGTSNPFAGTVNPYTQVASANKCTLTPIKQDAEDEAPQPLVFKGEKNDLNRANLDADNMTITSKVQAQLTCENGKWYIQDTSAQQTTFVRAAEKTALKDGDIILMGNRQFIFKAQ